jgi:hypothetical protein
MNTFVKEQIAVINGFSLPMDVLGVIKGYLYYDMNTMVYAKKIAADKQPILEKIKNSISRNNVMDYFDGMNEEDQEEENWVFTFIVEDHPERTHLQCINCKKCGNYKDFTHEKDLYYAIRRKIPIMCLCKDNEFLNTYKRYQKYDPDFDDGDNADHDTAANDSNITDYYDVPDRDDF